MLSMPVQDKEIEVTILTRALGGLTVAAVLALGFAGVLSEAHRAPDQS
jgi:hypothetical protein